MTLSAWLMAAARERIRQQRSSDLFESPADLENFFRECDALEGGGTEPDWDEHLDVINRSRRAGCSSS